MPHALITGASSGLGMEFARQLAAQRYNLTLLARNEQRLATLADELRGKHNRTVSTLPVDLTTASGRDTAATHLANGGFDLLVNNAGIGLAGEFWEASQDDLQEQLDLNVTAVLQLSRAAVSPMIERGHGGIINVSSVAGFFPGRGSTYTAGKNWVTSFSEGIGAALPTGVRMMALCPGFTHTEFHQRAGIAKPGPKLFWLSAEQVVREGLADLHAGKPVSIPSVQYKALVGLSRLVPRGALRGLSAAVSGGRT